MQYVSFPYEVSVVSHQRSLNVSGASGFVWWGVERVQSILIRLCHFSLSCLAVTQTLQSGIDNLVVITPFLFVSLKFYKQVRPGCWWGVRIAGECVGLCRTCHLKCTAVWPNVFPLDHKLDVQISACVGFNYWSGEREIESCNNDFSCTLIICSFCPSMIMNLHTWPPYPTISNRLNCEWYSGSMVIVWLGFVSHALFILWKKPCSNVRAVTQTFPSGLIYASHSRLCLSSHTGGPSNSHTLSTPPILLCLANGICLNYPLCNE